MGKLRQISVLGMGLLGGSITLAIQRTFSGVKAVGYSHRDSTRKKAKLLGVADEIADNLKDAVADADVVILATPICTFEEYFCEMSGELKDGCIVTDVGSTKVLAHKWATKSLGKNVHYVGSHPIAGSEQRGVDFARDDLFENSDCILTKTKNTNAAAIQTLKDFWLALGCTVKSMSPAEHDKILGNISHLPHMVAAGLVNASDKEELKLAGLGFIDTSRIASGPANVWSDILVTNSANCGRVIDRFIKELQELQKAVKCENKEQIEKLLNAAKSKREGLIKYKLRKKELL